MENHFLCHSIWGKEFFNGQIVVAAAFHCLSYPLVTFTGEVEGLDNAHALKLFQYRFYQLCFCLLPLWGNTGGAFSIAESISR